MKPIIVSDFDGTISQVDVTDLLLTQRAHPSWREIEQEWARGSIGSRECLQRQLALVDASAGEIKALIDSVVVDPHFNKFYRFIRGHHLPFYVVSDGFDFVIRRVLKNTGLDSTLHFGRHLFSSRFKVHGRRIETSFPYSGPPCQHDCATCKSEVIRRLRSDEAPVIFIGDGFSDRFAAQAADIVFAKRQLLVYCRENGIACRPYETFAEIEAEIEALLADSLAGEMPRWREPKTKARKLKAEFVVRD